MIEWSEQHEMIRETVRRFVDAEIVPNLEELEHGDTPPYDVLRKLYATFGMDEMARTRFEKQIEREKSGAPKSKSREGGGDGAGMMLIPIIELCRYCPGMVTAMGVAVLRGSLGGAASRQWLWAVATLYVGLAAGRIVSLGLDGLTAHTLFGGVLEVGLAVILYWCGMELGNAGAGASPGPAEPTPTGD